MFHNREYLVAIRPLDGVLALHTMRFADELVDPGDLDVPSPSRKPTKREIEMASKLVDSLHDDFTPEDFSDSYRERVLALIAAKARGEEPDAPERGCPTRISPTWRPRSRRRWRERASRWPARCGQARSASGSSTCRSR